MIREIFNAIQNWRLKTRQARAAWEFRVGYLSVLDRRLFPDEPPMLSDSERLRLLIKSEAFRYGCDMARARNADHSRLSFTAENAMRLVVSDA
jgi:hypothetical protein